MTELPCPICSQNLWKLFKGETTLQFRCIGCGFQAYTNSNITVSTVVGLMESAKND